MRTDQLQRGLDEPPQRSLDFTAATRSPAAELTRVVGELGAVSRPYLARLPLDHTGLPGCSDACVEESLKVCTTSCNRVPVMRAC